MADYAELLTDLKLELGARDSPVIGFGGSYGGMLATWMRIKYPWILDGAIAGPLSIRRRHCRLSCASSPCWKAAPSAAHQERAAIHLCFNGTGLDLHSSRPHGTGTCEGLGLGFMVRFRV
jgi:pimeloyl-ACP methyl ester carboxylesterase